MKLSNYFGTLFAVSLLSGCSYISERLNPTPPPPPTPKQQMSVVELNTGSTAYCGQAGVAKRQGYVQNLLNQGWVIKNTSNSSFQARSPYYWHDGKPCSFTTYILEK